MNIGITNIYGCIEIFLCRFVNVFKMHTITIRIEDDVFNKIEDKRGNQSKSEFYRKIIEYYLNPDEDEININEYKLSKDEYNS